jgi:hypothetical protein
MIDVKFLERQTARFGTVVMAADAILGHQLLLGALGE